MFERAGKGVEVAANLAGLKVRLILRALGRMVSATGGAVLAGVLAGAGILGFLGAFYLSVSPLLGRSASLLIVSGAALLLA